MADHQRRPRIRQHVAERPPIAGFQCRERRVEPRGEMVGVGTHAAEAREVLHRGTDARRLQPARVGAGDVADNIGIAGNRAG